MEKVKTIEVKTLTNQVLLARRSRVATEKLFFLGSEEFFGGRKNALRLATKANGSSSWSGRLGWRKSVDAGAGGDDRRRSQRNNRRGSNDEGRLIGWWDVSDSAYRRRLLCLVRSVKWGGLGRRRSVLDW